MSDIRDLEAQTPTIVTATAVSLDKDHAGSGGNSQSGGSVPVVVAQPWGVQEQVGRNPGFGARHHHVAIQQQTLPNGRNVVTFATLNTLMVTVAWSSSSPTVKYN